MRQRRMFSKDVVRKNKFLKLPIGARLLYFDLGLDADDDGVVDVLSCIRATEASADSLKALEDNGFICALAEDEVYYIPDWRIHNLLRKDRYKPSLYQNMLPKYQLPEWLNSSRQPNDNQMTTNGMHSIGENREGKDRIDKERVQTLSPADKAALTGEGIPEHYLSDQTRIIRASEYAQKHGCDMLTTIRAFWQKDKEQEAQSSYGDGDAFFEAALKAGFEE